MQTELLREELLSKAETMKILPTINTIISELLRIMNDKNSSFNQLFDVVRYDQAISSKVMSIANSAYYSRGYHIVNLQRAMVVIGFEEIKNIVMCLVFLTEILNRWKLTQKDLATLWSHSLTVAYAAKTLSNATMTEDPEKVFTISILHDIGKVIFCMYGDQYRKITEEAQRSSVGLTNLEREKFGIDHQEVGYIMSVKWRFPEEFSEIIRHHHDKPGGENQLLDLVRIADKFVDNPGADLGAQGLILQKEKEKIDGETMRISRLMGVMVHG